MVGVPIDPNAVNTEVAAVTPVSATPTATPSVATTGPVLAADEQNIPTDPKVEGLDWMKAFALRGLSGDYTYAHRFATSLGASNEQLGDFENAFNMTVNTGDKRILQNSMAEIIGTKEPADLIKAMKDTDPSAAPLLNEIEKYPDLVNAIHTMVSKDITSLSGLQALAKGEGTTTSPADIIEALKDDTTRQTLIEAMEITGENPDIKFDDFAELVQSGIDLKSNTGDPEKARRYKAAIDKFGMAAPEGLDFLTGDFNWQDILKMVVDFFKHPEEMVIKLADMSGMDFGAPGSVQRTALEGDVHNIVGGLLGSRPGEPNLGTIIEYYTPQAIKAGEDRMGITDDKAEAARLAAEATTTTVPGSTPGPAAEAVLPDIAVTQNVDVASVGFDDSAYRALVGTGVPGNLDVAVADTKTAFLSNNGSGLFGAVAQGPALGTPEYLASLGLKPEVSPEEQAGLEEYDRRNKAVINHGAPAPTAMV